MAIKGLSDARRMPRLGKIHLGIKKQGKGDIEYPSPTDYFVFDKEHPDYDKLVELYGEQPKELRIMIPVEDEEKWASQFYRCYSRTRGLICKGDGEVAMRMVDTQTGALADRDSKNVKLVEMTCPGRECEDYGNKCHEVMNLQFMLYEAPGLGIWQIDTGSINSIININSAADFIRGFYGRIRGIPLVLSLEPKEVTPPDGKKKTVRVLHLRANHSVAELSRFAQLSPAEVVGEFVQLPPGDDDRPDVVPDWEPPGDKTPEPMSHVEVEEAVQDLWPEAEEKPKPKKRQAKKAEKEPEPEPVGEQSLVPAAPRIETPIDAVQHGILTDACVKAKVSWEQVGIFCNDANFGHEWGITSTGKIKVWQLDIILAAISDGTLHSGV